MKLREYIKDKIQTNINEAVDPFNSDAFTAMKMKGKVFIPLKPTKKSGSESAKLSVMGGLELNKYTDLSHNEFDFDIIKNTVYLVLNRNGIRKAKVRFAKDPDYVINLVDYAKKAISKVLGESINESEQLDERAVVYNNRANYGQVVFLAGGAGSGKGFAQKKFLDVANYKVRDVDEMKKGIAQMERLGKISLDVWLDRYSQNLKEWERDHIEKFVLKRGMRIQDLADNMKNPKYVTALHIIVDAMGLKDRWLMNLLAGKNNPRTLPNILFDMTAKKVKSINDVIKQLLQAGYDPKNIHLTWILASYDIAVERNKTRDRVVPADVQLKTHQGAAKTVWDLVTKIKPRSLNGRIDVVLANEENTIFYTDKKGKPLTKAGAIKGFTSLPIKKEGKGFLPEKTWKLRLYRWILKNAPSTINVRKD